MDSALLLIVRVAQDGSGPLTCYARASLKRLPLVTAPHYPCFWARGRIADPTPSPRPYYLRPDWTTLLYTSQTFIDGLCLLCAFLSYCFPVPLWDCRGPRDWLRSKGPVEEYGRSWASRV